MNYEYDSDFSGQSSTTSYSTDDIHYEKTKTKRGLDAIKIENEIYVFKKFNKNNTIYWRCQNNNCPTSVTTWIDLGCINGIDHSHDNLAPILPSNNLLIISVRGRSCPRARGRGRGRGRDQNIENSTKVLESQENDSELIRN
ncbi:unnamed protein product [Brachionus calyciflorus]|uniref:FLYWCH-type domain-containing protein n=1 Tax=Brachionus calyciflorus TaxID=104777 RepID=A0A814EWF1_9BILA|nr:unnamed protein product [Brachionus calyciflorus]